MQHYGRGVGHVPMPRAFVRKPRKEWPISPSFVIFVLSVLIILLMKLTLSNEKLFKVTQTIIIMPQTQPAPEPTVPQSVPLIKVLRDAVKKTVEPKRIELKKIVPKKIEPKKPIAKKIVPKKIKPPEALAKKIAPKRVVPSAIKPKELQPKKLETQKITSKKIDLAKTVPPQKSLTADLKPKRPELPPATLTSANVPKHAAPSRSFNAMPTIQRNSAAVPSPSSSAAPLPRSSVTASRVPELTQLEEYKPDLIANSATSAPIAHAPKIAAAPPTPIHDIAPSFNGPAIEDLVIIRSSVLGNSERVKNLKRAIMKKARNMNPNRSPYTYSVKGYICTLIVEAGNQSKIIIDFSPADAPFDVVSALERLLPR